MKNKNNLLVDVGNSFVKWCLAPTNSEFSESIFLNADQIASTENIESNFFVELWSNIDKPENVFVSCVAEDNVFKALQLACETLWSLQVDNISATKEAFGLLNAYTTPETLGSDRWCAMIAAYAVTSTDLIIVDSGSALTIDVVKATGVHLGGYILPGLTMMKKSLQSDTAEVRISSGHREALSPGINTKDGVDAAVMLSATKLIEAVYLEQEKTSDNLQCILSGGDATVLSKLLSVKNTIMPNIVLRGLAQIALNKKES